MKIFNLKTKHIFDLPKEEAKLLLETCPNEFVKGTKPRKIEVIEKFDETSIVSKIIE